jgi:protein TonB
VNRLVRAGFVEAMAIVASLAVHGGVVAALGNPPERAPKPVFVAARIVLPKPPPPPLPSEPAPEVAPEPLDEPKPEPRKAPEPPPTPAPVASAPPPPAQAEPLPRRVVQGLSASSFAPGSGTGVAVRAGNTLSAAAVGHGAPLDAIPTYAAAVERPKCKKPSLKIPDSVRRDRVEGLVGITFDVAADGRVSNVRVTDPLSPDADAACVSAWSGTTCKPGTDGSAAVAVTDVPFTCRFEAITP